MKNEKTTEKTTRITKMEPNEILEALRGDITTASRAADEALEKYGRKTQAEARTDYEIRIPLTAYVPWGHTLDGLSKAIKDGAAYSNKPIVTFTVWEENTDREEDEFLETIVAAIKRKGEFCIRGRKRINEEELRAFFAALADRVEAAERLEKGTPCAFLAKADDGRQALIKAASEAEAKDYLDYPHFYSVFIPIFGMTLREKGTYSAACRILWGPEMRGIKFYEPSRMNENECYGFSKNAKAIKELQLQLRPKVKEWDAYHYGTPQALQDREKSRAMLDEIYRLQDAIEALRVDEQLTAE